MGVKQEMCKFFFHKVGRHFILADIQKAERYRILLMKKNRCDVFHLSTTEVKLPYHVLVRRKLVCVVATTREDAISWLKTQKWSEL